MTLGFALLILGAIVVYAGMEGMTVADVILGKPKPAHEGLLTTRQLLAEKARGGLDTLVPPGQLFRTRGSTPKQIIDSAVVPLARKHHMRTGIDPHAIVVANGHHGPTVDGNRSDHQGPPEEAWASDMSNGTSPTKEMDALARDIARRFKIEWTGSGVASATWGGFRYQLLYRTSVGGNHFNHVHFGVKKET